MINAIRRGGQDAWVEFLARYSALIVAYAKRRGLSDHEANQAVVNVAVSIRDAVEKVVGGNDDLGPALPWVRTFTLHAVRGIRPGDVGDGTADAVAARFGCADYESEQVFDEEWNRNLLARALDDVRGSFDAAVFAALEKVVVAGLSIDQVANISALTRHDMCVTGTRLLSRIKSRLAELREAEEAL